MESRKNIFISYSHHDKQWVEKLHVFLKPLVRSIQIDVWDDTKIRPGADWKEEVEAALDKSQIAILMVSSHFLASDFILDDELPKILKRESSAGLVIMWVCLSHCLYNETELSVYEAANTPFEPLDSLPEYEQNQVLVDICEKIKKATSPASSQHKTDETTSSIPEIPQDDWSNNPNSLLKRIKKFF